jgi:ribonuclease E
MGRTILINAIHPEESRVAIVENGHLVELEVEKADHSQLKGNIYKSEITRIEPSLQAAFLDIGASRNGFLQINDINAAYFNDWNFSANGKRFVRPAIQNVLSAKQELVVQVVKDQRDAKGATLTTNLSIPGRYLVLMIGNQRGGVSRKIADEGQRRKLRQAIQSLRVPPGMGVIVRTAGINKSSEELQEDLNNLLATWQDIITASMEPGAPKMLYQESDLACRMLRDFYSREVDEVLIDEEETFKRVVKYAEKVIPNLASQIKLYNEHQPLFSSFHLDAQVDQVNSPEVILPSGGSIVISPTEAIVAIDVNSGRATGQSDVEETAFETNKEAARTIAEQLRLRDLGGLIVIDFIDMLDRRHKQIVEKVLKDSVRYDKARVEVGRLSKFGLIEMSRQRLKSSVSSQNQSVCHQCNGRGRVKTPESAALEALRKIQSSVYAGGIGQVRVRLAPAAALLLLNNKRQILTNLEEATKTKILVFADGRMKPDEYELEVDTGHHSPTTLTNAPQADSHRNRGGEGGQQRRDRDSQDPRRDRNNRNRNRSGGRNRNNNNRRDRGPNYNQAAGEGGGQNRDQRRNQGPRNNRDAQNGRRNDRRYESDQRPNRDSTNPTPNTETRPPDLTPKENLVRESAPEIITKSDSDTKVIV